MSKKKKRRKSRLGRNILIAVVLIVAGIFVARSTGLIGKKKLTQVFTAKAKKVTIVEQVSASGKIQPEIEVKISPDVSGEIVEVLVEEGDSVVKGQLLLKIRPDNLQAALDNSQAILNSRKAATAQAEAAYYQRKAEYERLKLEFERSKTLYEQKVISEADFQLAEANFNVAKQQLTSAKQNIEATKYNAQSAAANVTQNLDNLSRTSVFSPVNGTISKLNVEKGEKVVGTAQMAGTEMLRIANLNNMEVQVDVNENDIVRVELKDTAVIEVDAYISQNKKFKGVVTEIANTANPTTSPDAVTEFKVKVRILQESYQDLLNKKRKMAPFRPGMTASVEIRTNTKNNVLSVPLAAVTTRVPGSDKKKKGRQGRGKPNNAAKDNAKKKKSVPQEVVFVYDANTKKVSKRKVKTGISDFENIEILKGLKEGEEVVTGPFAVISKRLKDKELVKKTDKDDMGKK
ncbi:efflux RND transporter periplasmic adaptor subunit [uncultured Microscilla sp.]|uniref:efflux RND transporter periplasmic adaptor subunit n=1 Tax=uncultured Microscilla sp. TaxID=432653 RepID=UPI002604754F|nr:efflux RND transporter periplasmic adaptor subunit [uncultured Microscilla sp.]